MSKVYLNGNLVSGSEIDAKKHRFVGMFREPYKGSDGMVMCPCGEYLKSIQAVYDHWLRGHSDIPQYESIPTYKNDYTLEDFDVRLPDFVIREYKKYATGNMLFGQRIALLDRDSLIAAVGYLLDKIAGNRW